MYHHTIGSCARSNLLLAAKIKKIRYYLIIMWTLLYKGLMLKYTQDKLLKMFIIAVVIINYTHE